MFTNSINHLQKNIHSTYINRITIITLLISILFTFNTLYFQSIGKGISLYSGLYQTTVQSHIVEILLLIVGISILLGWPYLASSGPASPLAVGNASPTTVGQGVVVLPDFLIKRGLAGFNQPGHQELYTKEATPPPRLLRSWREACCLFYRGQGTSPAPLPKVGLYLKIKGPALFFTK